MPQREDASRPGASLRLLGGWQLVVDGSDVRLSHREQRLTAFLGLSGERARPHVAGQLWPDSTDERALASLRRAVMQTQHARPGLLRVDRAFVGLDPEIEVDVAEVRLAAEVSELPESPEEQSRLLALLSGDELLPGWYDDWVLAERESLAQLRLRALDRISRQALDQGDLVLAIEAARCATDIEPHSEAACEVALRAHLARGDLAGAVAEFRRYREATWDNVGVAPSGRIVALVESAFGADVDDASPVPAELHLRRRLLLWCRCCLHPRPRLPHPRHPCRRCLRRRPRGRRPAAGGHGHAGPRCGSRTTETTGRNARVLAGLAGAAVLLMAVSLVVAVGGPDRGGSGPEASARTTAPMAAGRLDGSSDGRGVLDRVGQQLSVQPAGVLPGVARFTLSAASLPASVQLTIRNASGPLVVRTLKVTSRDGRRVVLDGLPAGWSQWKATSPDVDPVSGRVWVPRPPLPPPPRRRRPPRRPPPARPPPAPTPQPSPTPQPTPQPTPTSPSPTPTAQPTPSPAHNPAPTQPDPTAHPPPTQPTTQPTAQPHRTAHRPRHGGTASGGVRRPTMSETTRAASHLRRQSLLLALLLVTAGLLTVTRAAEATPVAASSAARRPTGGPAIASPATATPTVAGWAATRSATHRCSW